MIKDEKLEGKREMNWFPWNWWPSITTTTPITIHHRNYVTASSDSLAKVTKVTKQWVNYSKDKIEYNSLKKLRNIWLLSILLRFKRLQLLPMSRTMCLVSFRYCCADALSWRVQRSLTMSHAVNMPDSQCISFSLHFKIIASKRMHV